MEKEMRIIEPELLLEEYRHLLQECRDIELPLVVSGNSMSPFLVNGRDTVYLSRLQRPARRGDILLYRRDNGAYVLHRVFRVTREGCTMVGDAQTMLEPGIRQDQILAAVTRAQRKGKRQEKGCFWWDFFEKVWIRMVPLRPALRKFYSLLRRSA